MPGAHAGTRQARAPVLTGAPPRGIIDAGDTPSKKRLRRSTCRLRPKKKEKNTMPTCENTRPCPCTYPCPRHGKCCECVAHHRDREGGVPGCFFTKEGEATYDRSIPALWRDYSNRK